MNNSNTEKFFETVNSEGNAVLCPIDEANTEKKPTAEARNEDCFEKDVMGRYASNIKIVE